MIFVFILRIQVYLLDFSILRGFMFRSQKRERAARSRLHDSVTEEGAGRRILRTLEGESRTLKREGA
jgi:hypothetical protein